MNAVYPGTFSPPTQGHVEVVKYGCKHFDHVLIVCSDRNTEKMKDRWFSPDEAKDLWHGYDLPKKCKVVTQDEVVGKSWKDWVLLRGLRLDSLEEDLKVEAANFPYAVKFGIDSVHMKVNSHGISSTMLRRAVTKHDFKNLRALSKTGACPRVMYALWKKVYNIKNLFLVVGRAGSGKTTLLKEMVKLSDKYRVIYTDHFNQELKPILQKKFSGQDLIQLVIKDRKAIVKELEDLWGQKLLEELDKSQPGETVFVECAFGIEEDTPMFEWLTDRIVYVLSDYNEKRLQERGTPQHIPMLGTVSSLQQVIRIPRFDIKYFDTNGSLQLLAEKAKIWHETLSR